MFKIARVQACVFLTAGAVLGYGIATGELSFKRQAAAAPEAVGSAPATSVDPIAAPGKLEAPVLVALQKIKTETKEAAPRESVSPSGWIGVMLEHKKGEGLRIVNVFPGGPAAFAGARAGDVLEKIGATTPASAIETIERTAPRQPLSLTVRRDGKPLELKATVGNLMEFHGHYAAEMARRDPRDPNFGLQHGVTEADMSVEVVRRIFEQNQQTHTTLQFVLEELHALRKELRARGK
jgi:hypothetical protein